MAEGAMRNRTSRLAALEAGWRGRTYVWGPSQQAHTLEEQRAEWLTAKARAVACGDTILPVIFPGIDHHYTEPGDFDGVREPIAAVTLENGQ
jgi:hypothetical protein